MTSDELDRQVEKFMAEHQKSSWVAWTIVTFVLATIMAAGVTAFLYVDGNQDEGRARGVARELRIAALETDYAKLYAQFERCKEKRPDAAGCVEPVTPEPDDITPHVTVQEGDTTVIRQVEMLPPAAVRAAVTDACGGSCKGRDVTAEMIREAILENCGGSCKGESVKGDKGDPADPPSDAQILAAVANYCSTTTNCASDGPSCPAGYTAGVLTVVMPFGKTADLFACIANESP